MYVCMYLFIYLYTQDILSNIKLNKQFSSYP